MKKKLVSILLTATMAAGLLAGCGSDSSTDTASNTDTESSEEDTSEAETEETDTEEKNADASITLNWAIWDKDLVTYWNDLADAYMEQNPDVKIELTDLGSSDYMTVLATDLSGDGSDFDIVTVKDVPGYATLVSKGVLEDLTDRISSDGIDLSQYNGITDQLTTEDGKLYEMPFRDDIWVLFYNKDLFDDAGVEYPTNDMTVEEWDALARQVAKTGFGDDAIYGTHYHTWRSAVQLFGVLDGQHTILDGNYDWAKPYYEMVKQQEEDGICRTYVDTNASSLHYSAAFSEGNVATMNMGTWYISTLISELASGEYDSELCGNWGIVKYPHPEGVAAGTTLGQITSLAIPTSSDQKDAAWDFIKFASGQEGAKIVAESGAMPAILNDETTGIIASLDGFPQDENSKEALQAETVYLEAPYDENVSEINTILDTYHKDIMNGDISIDDGIAKMNEEVGKILNQ